MTPISRPTGPKRAGATHAALLPRLTDMDGASGFSIHEAA